MSNMHFSIFLRYGLYDKKGRNCGWLLLLDLTGTLFAVRSAKSSTEGGVGTSAHLAAGRCADVATAFSGSSGKLKNIARVWHLNIVAAKVRKVVPVATICDDCDLGLKTLSFADRLARAV